MRGIKALTIVFLFFILVSFSKAEDICTTNPTDPSCFENYQTIPSQTTPDETSTNTEEPSAENEEGIESGEKSFFSSWIFWIFIILIILIAVVIIYLYLNNRVNTSGINPPTLS